MVTSMLQTVRFQNVWPFSVARSGSGFGYIMFDGNGWTADDEGNVKIKSWQQLNILPLPCLKVSMFN